MWTELGARHGKRRLRCNQCGMEVAWKSDLQAERLKHTCAASRSAARDRADDQSLLSCPVTGRACPYLLMQPDAFGGQSPVCRLDLDAIGGRCSESKRRKATAMLASRTAGDCERRQECGSPG